MLGISICLLSSALTNAALQNSLYGDSRMLVIRSSVYMFSAGKLLLINVLVVFHRRAVVEHRAVRRPHMRVLVSTCTLTARQGLVFLPRCRCSRARSLVASTLTSQMVLGWKVWPVSSLKCL